MKIVVIGGTGLIGSKVVTLLTQQGHEALAAAPNTGVNTLTGEGLAKAMEGASVVVDVANSPSFADAAVMEFFETSTRNLLAHEARAGVGHHVALSVVGTERLPDSGYLRAKLKQEELIRNGAIPWSIVHATQFFEFVRSIAAGSTVDGVIRLPRALIQPIASEEVSRTVAEVALGAPLRRIYEVGGPDELSFDDFIRQGLRARNDVREIVVDPAAPYFGTLLEERSLLTGPGARIGKIHLQDWLRVPENVK